MRSRLVGPAPAALRWAALAAALLAVAVPPFLGDYGISVLTEMAIFVLFAASLHLIMGPGGMASFGHAAYFGLGAYGAALAAQWLGAPMLAGLAMAPLLAGHLRPGLRLLLRAAFRRLFGDADARPSRRSPGRSPSNGWR